MFLTEPGTAEASAYLNKKRAESGSVMNLERAWAWRPDVAEGFALLRGQLLQRTSLTQTEIALLACTTARVRSDSYCSLAWGMKLAGMRGAAVVADVLRGVNPSMATARESALKRWTEQIARDPNGASPTQIEELRNAGVSDREIFEATVHIAFRLAFSTVNQALGAVPDHELLAAAPAQIQAAITYGRTASAASLRS